MLNAPLRFDEGYFERIWGGRMLASHFGKHLPPNAPVGEAWLISDHPQFTSTVAHGPCAGRSLRALMDEYPRDLLGNRAAPTPDGRFPLLLKLLDARDVLSVQVHPNDEEAQRLGESDAGKTEMWHVLDAEPGAELICGLEPSVDAAALARGVQNGGVQEMLTRFPAPSGTSVFVPAGTVHAIGAGLVLAEIQQNSDVTYRLFDWERTDSQGRPRELHLEKALQVARFGVRPSGPARTVSYTENGAAVEFLCACPYFAAERLRVDGEYQRNLDGGSFHILLAISGGILEVSAGTGVELLHPGEAALIPGVCSELIVRGAGGFMLYYVPELDATRKLLADNDLRPEEIDGVLHPVI